MTLRKLHKDQVDYWKAFLFKPHCMEHNCSQSKEFMNVKKNSHRLDNILIYS